jgi:hypothetical protein
MDAPTPTAHPQPPGSLPAHLEEKLRTCEVIAARMSVLQQQVDAEIQQLDRAQHDGPITSFYASPAILSAVNKLLRWIREKVAIH